MFSVNVKEESALETCLSSMRIQYGRRGSCRPAGRTSEWTEGCPDKMPLFREKREKRAQRALLHGPPTWTGSTATPNACAQTHLSKISLIIKMQNARGHARYRSSACGNVVSSVFFKSAQVTLWGSQNLSFQNHARTPAISLQHTPSPGQKRNRWTALSSRFLAGDLAVQTRLTRMRMTMMMVVGMMMPISAPDRRPSLFPSARPVRASALGQLLRKWLVP